MERVFLDTPLGTVTILVEGDLPRRIILGSLGTSPYTFLQETSRFPRSGVVGEVVEALLSYFSGKEVDNDLAIRLVDLSQPTLFQKRVFSETIRIPRGKVVSYGELAERIGNPRGARAVGRALSWNPFPVLIPCHRVVAKGGKLGGFSQGKEWKSALLAFEGVNLENAVPGKAQGGSMAGIIQVPRGIGAEGNPGEVEEIP
ncbi:MAG: methylated-DNA--[protein]-cysteine S-methyltransferase [Candidatus Geothermincolales bacterium]